MDLVWRDDIQNLSVEERSCQEGVYRCRRSERQMGTWWQMTLKQSNEFVINPFFFSFFFFFLFVFFLSKRWRLFLKYYQFHAIYNSLQWVSCTHSYHQLKLADSVIEELCKDCVCNDQTNDTLQAPVADIHTYRLSTKIFNRDNRKALKVRQGQGLRVSATGEYTDYGSSQVKLAQEHIYIQ